MLKRCAKDKIFQVNVQMNAEEKRRLIAQANRYTNGNISEWIRYSSLELKPNAKDLFKKGES